MRTLTPPTGPRFNGDRAKMTPNGDLQLALDLCETWDNLICKVDVPGMEPRDVHVLLRDNVLTIRGAEWRYGAFSRSVRLPSAVDSSKVKATFKSGVLTVVMVKVPRGRDIEVPIKIA